MTAIPPPGPLAYEGNIPLPYVLRTFDPPAPSAVPNSTFTVPTMWVNTASGEAWILTQNPIGAANWEPITTGITSISLTGDTGGALTGSAFTIYTDAVSNHCGGTVSISGSASTLTLNVADINSNMVIGKGSGKFVTSGGMGTDTILGGASVTSASYTGFDNTCVGYDVLSGCTSGHQNVSIGADSGNHITTGSNNTIVGTSAANNAWSTGSNSIIIGSGSGNNLSGSESNNIIISNTGTNGDNHTIRIGTQGSGTGQQNLCYVSGITGASPVNVNSPQVTLCDSSGNLTVVPDATPGLVLTSNSPNSPTFQAAFTIPLPIADGGTNATSFTQSNGIVTYNGTRLVNYAGPQISSSGYTTNTSQPAFMAYLATNDVNQTGAGTDYKLGNTSVGGVALTVVTDHTSSFTPSAAGGAFYTAPVTGNYLLQYQVLFNDITAAMTFGVIDLITNAASYRLGELNTAAVADSFSQGVIMSGSILAPMTAGDKCQWQVTISGGMADTATIRGATQRVTFVSGYLVC